MLSTFEFLCVVGGSAIGGGEYLVIFGKRCWFIGLFRFMNLNFRYIFRTVFVFKFFFCIVWKDNKVEVI